MPQAKSGFEGWHDFAFPFRDPQSGGFSGVRATVSAGNPPSNFVFRRFCEIGSLRLPRQIPFAIWLRDGGIGDLRQETAAFFRQSDECSRERIRCDKMFGIITMEN